MWNEEIQFCYGMHALCVYFLQGDVWLCMEVMDVSLDKFYRVLYGEDRRIPEIVLRKITVDVSVDNM